MDPEPQQFPILEPASRRTVGGVFPVLALDVISQYLPRDEPRLLLRLAQVNRNFYHYYMSDIVWQRFNAYGLKENIATHYIKTVSELSNEELVLLFCHRDLDQLVGFVGYRTKKLSHAEFSNLSLYTQLTLVVKNSRWLPEDLKINSKTVICCAVLSGSRWALHRAAQSILNDRQFIFSMLRQHGGILEHVSMYQSDPEAVKIASLSAPDMIRHVKPSDRTREQVWQLVHAPGAAPSLWDTTRFLGDRELVLAVVSHRGRLFTRLQEKKFLDDEDIFTAAFLSKPDTFVFKRASDRLRADPQFMLGLFRKLYAQEHNSQADWDRLELYTAEIRRSLRDYFEVCPVEIKENKDIVLVALKLNAEIVDYVSPPLKSDGEVILTALRQASLQFKGRYSDSSAEVIKDIPIQYCMDRNFMLDAIDCNASVMKLVHEELKYDKTFVLEATQRNGFALRWAPEQFRMDPELVDVAIMTCPAVLGFVPREYQTKDLAIAGLKQDGSIYRQLADYLKRDVEVAVLALSAWDLNFSHIPVEVRQDRAFILKALKVNHLIISYIPDYLGNDREIVRAAARIDSRRALNEVGYKLCEDSLFMREIVSCYSIGDRYT